MTTVNKRLTPFGYGNAHCFECARFTDGAVTQCPKCGVDCIVEPPVDFATTLNIGGIANKFTTTTTTTTTTIAAAHPFEIVRIVSTFFNASRIPRPEFLAADAEHLIATLGFENVRSASRARFRVAFEQFDRFDVSGITNVRLNFFGGGAFDLVAVRAGEFFTNTAFPGGRYESETLWIATFVVERAAAAAATFDAGHPTVGEKSNVFL